MVDRDFEYELGSNAPSISWDIETPHGGGYLYKSRGEWTLERHVVVGLEFKNTLYWIGQGRLSHWKALERAVEIMAKEEPALAAQKVSVQTAGSEKESPMVDENRPTSDEFECESCGECIFENEAVECENCSRGCCTLCSPESICPDCQE